MRLILARLFCNFEKKRHNKEYIKYHFTILPYTHDVCSLSLSILTICNIPLLFLPRLNWIKCVLSLSILNYLQYTPTLSTPIKLNQMCALSLSILNYLQYTPTLSTPIKLNQMCALSLSILNYLQYTRTLSTPIKLNQICALSLNIYYLQYTPPCSTPSTESNVRSLSEY